MSASNSVRKALADTDVRGCSCAERPASHAIVPFATMSRHAAKAGCTSADLPEVRAQQVLRDSQELLPCGEEESGKSL